LYYKNLKKYSDSNLKEKLWYEVCESVFTKWSEPPAEHKSEKKKYVNFLVNIIGDHADEDIGQKRTHYTEKHRSISNC
jgi:hypothetical protein